MIPLLWTVVGGSAAFLLGVAQDWPLLVSGLVVVAMIERRRHALPRALRV